MQTFQIFALIFVFLSFDPVVYPTFYHQEEVAHYIDCHMFFFII